MGIKGLTTLIKTSAPSAIQTQNLHHLTGKKVAIDASLFMYKMLINMRTSNQSQFCQKILKLLLIGKFNLVMASFLPSRSIKYQGSIHCLQKLHQGNIWFFRAHWLTLR